MANRSRLFIATRKGLFTAERGNAGWSITQAEFLGQTLSLVHADAKAGTVYAAFNHGHFGVKLHRSDDGGKTYAEVATPTYPELPPGEKPIVDDMGRTIPNTTQQIWALTDDGKGRLWCGTIPGGLFSSDDRGASWQLNRALWDRPERKKWMGGGADYPGLHSICIDPRDHRRMYIAVSTGGVWSTTDRGGTWQLGGKGIRADYMPPELAFDPAVQDVHCMVLCPANPDVLWVQHHNGIFRSTDGAATWSEIKAEPSSFGFAVAVHPDDADTAWFVPGMSDQQRIAPSGKVVVTRTRDGGKSFDVLTRGLPQTHAYDITLRHSLDIAPGAKSLAFGTSTGSLWVTDDQGDNWQTVANHLPPIYAVRFEK